MLVNRKRVVVALAISTLVFIHFAEAQSKKVPRIGWLSVMRGPMIPPAFLQGLGELGWFEGKNIAIESRFAYEKYDRLPKLAAELVKLKVDVIVAGDSAVIPAAKNATDTIPIVMVVSRDPVAARYVASLARPGGNITGLSNQLIGINGKRLQILKESIPNVSRVAIISPFRRADWTKLEATSQSLGMIPLVLYFEDQIERLLNTAKTKRANGLMVIAGPKTSRERKTIITFASRYRLPVMYPHSLFVADGGLMSYGPNLPVMLKRAAVYVDKILKGVKPADLPVERPMRTEFVINVKAANEIGLKIPPEVLQRADKVIQ